MTSSSTAPDHPIDTTPFLPPSLYAQALTHSSSVRTQGLRQAAMLLRRASTSRRMMREPSVMVREVAAQQIEYRQTDWSFSIPVVLLDVAWNLLFVSAAAAVLAISRHEQPSTPLRVWIVGYALLCLVHVLSVCGEYRRRSRTVDGEAGEEEEERSWVTRHLESSNTVFSFVWWVIGFYWICVGGEALQLNSPDLYWMCALFLAFDVFFVVFCVVVVSVVAVAVCCCLPCIIGLLYVLADQTGAAKEDIDLLPTYKYQRIGDEDKDNGEIQALSEGVMTECSTNSPIHRKLSAEASECCICLSAYEDGTELRELPCGHHFHCSCVDKWLHINSTCPLCKYDILTRNRRDCDV